MPAPEGLFPATSMPDRDWWAALWPDPTAVLRQMGIAPEMTVLDLCCGDGYFTAPLAGLTGGKVHALDLDPAMIAQAQVVVAQQGASVRQWICADAMQAAAHLPTKVDYVLLANTFHGVPDRRGLARVVRDLLHEDGLFGLVNWHALPRERTSVLGELRGPRTEMRMSPEVVTDVIAPAGFKLRRCVELPPYHHGTVFALRTDAP